ncbi:MAG: hypothetical protein Q8O99_04975 [bacterium]|nr:hypothetical protein [bacterium]
MECDATLLRCGDDIISSPQEECEGSNFNGETCQSQGYTAGDLVCVACQIDTSDCTDPSPPDVVKDNELIL